MKVRQFGKIADLKPVERFEMIAEGLRQIHDHITALEAAYSVVDKTAPGRAASLLGVIATEEAGKFLILLDAARMRQRNREAVRGQLRRAGNHLAKLIYAEAHDGRPATYGEVVRLVESYRPELYLDGPRDFDWVFRNELLARREELLYVDLVEGADGLEWWSPEAHDRLQFSSSPTATRLVHALHEVGLSTASALKATNKVWAGFEPTEDSHYQELRGLIEASVDAARQANGGIASDSKAAATVVDRWTFPMDRMEVGLEKVSLEELREVQRRREAYWLQDEAGYPEID